MYAECGKVKGGWGAKAAKADDEDLSGGDASLAGDGDCGEEGLAMVAGGEEGVWQEEDGGRGCFGRGQGRD